MKFRAPGRVNLIGEHTDYNDGYVLPVAIEMQTIATATPAPAMQFTSTSNPPPGWQAYVLGVEKQLRRRAVPIPNLAIEFSSTLPLGAGLSSSAALEVSAALAFIAAAGFELPAMEVAKLCQQAEIETVGLACGIMDQFISLHGRQNHAILLDCRNLAWRPVPIPTDITLVIADTGVKHALASSEYNTRRKECEAAAAALGIKSLRDATQDGGHKRARHIITENARVLAFVEALAINNRKALGELMAASHESLRTDYEVSCPELDAMVAAANQCPGLIGARMTGGGFGGSTINLVETNEAKAFVTKLAELYPGATIYTTRAANGAGPQNP
jgi:galactokinase